MRSSGTWVFLFVAKFGPVVQCKVQACGAWPDPRVVGGRRILWYERANRVPKKESVCVCVRSHFGSSNHLPSRITQELRPHALVLILVQRNVAAAPPQCRHFACATLASSVSAWQALASMRA